MSYVNKKMRPLVEVFLQNAIFTTESCQGHPNRQEKTLPYLSFEPIPTEMLHVLAHSVKCMRFQTKLCWKINVEMYYEQLLFTLEPEKPAIFEKITPKLVKFAQEDLKVIRNSIQFHFESYHKKEYESELEKCVKLYEEFADQILEEGKNAKIQQTATGEQEVLLATEVG